MADIAAIFHWPLSELMAMDVNELLNWRERAITRWNRMHGNGKEGSGR